MDLHTSYLDGELPQLCPIPINRETGTVKQEVEQATDFAIFLLKGNPISALKEFITEQEF